MGTRTLSLKGLIVAVAAAAILVFGTQTNAQTSQTKTHIGGKVSSLVSLSHSSSIAPNTTTQLSRVVATGAGGLSALVIPEGSVLVVTDVTVESIAPGGEIFVEICETGPCNVVPLRVGTTDRLTALHLTSGVPFRSAPDVTNAPGSDANVVVTLHGYFAKDK
jgi:hypothetical protein